MKYTTIFAMVAGVLFTLTGCGLITTRTVAIAAGKAVIENVKEEHEKEKEKVNTEDPNSS
jgi:hypothetical protein